MEHIAKAMELKAELDKLRPIGKEQEEIIMQKFRLDWDYHSNHLEGNSLTYGETKALILFGITAQGKPLKDHFEITGHDEAIKWVTEIVKGDYPLTEKFIRELHVLLLKEPHERPAETLDGQKTTKRIEVGKYKTTPNHVRTKTGEIFRFATPEETPALMHVLIEWYRQKKESADINPIILAAEFHYRFIRIHPFDDGNGRVARILMNFILMQFGYPPVIIKTEDKGNYYSVLQLADAGNIEPFINYIAQNLVRSLEIMIAGTKGENVEEPDDLDKEIALLEHKLKNVGKTAVKTRSFENILDVYDKSITILCKNFITACEKLDKYYVQNQFSAVINSEVGPYLDKLSAFSLIRNKIFPDTYRIELQYHHFTFNKLGFGEFNYLASIECKFNVTEYIVRTNENKKVIKKAYGDQLTDKEISELVSAAVKSHTDHINSKVKEVESKKPSNR